MAFMILDPKTGKPMKRSKRPSSAKSKPRTKSAKKTTALVKRVVKSELRAETELKLKPLRTVNQANPLAQAATGSGSNIVWYNNFCLGSPAATWTGPTGGGNFVGLGGFTWPQGTDQGQRIGRYMNIKHTTMNLRIACKGISSISTPIRFRVIVYKAKRNAAVGTTGGNPNRTLFIGTEGQELGLNNSYSGDSVGMEFQSMLVNKRNFQVHTDQQFILAPHVFSVQGGSNIVTPISHGYPAEKNMLLRLPHNDKVSFGSGDEPDDLNYQYCVSILSMPYGDNTQVNARSWVSNLRGVVSATDA